MNVLPLPRPEDLLVPDVPPRCNVSNPRMCSKLASITSLNRLRVRLAEFLQYDDDEYRHLLVCEHVR